jgi:hypothetical protein
MVPLLPPSLADDGSGSMGGYNAYRGYGPPPMGNMMQHGGHHMVGIRPLSLLTPPILCFAESSNLHQLTSKAQLVRRLMWLDIDTISTHAALTANEYTTERNLIAA